jgi:hypothetical protein
VQGGVLATQGGTGAQHGFRQALERPLPGHHLANPRLEASLGNLSELETKAAQDPAQAALKVIPPGLQLLARDQQGSDLLRRDVLAWTGRNQPMRIICAMLRASLRSVLIATDRSTAFTCRVSRSTASKPAPVKPTWIHCDSGPASSPTRVKARPLPLR